VSFTIERYPTQLIDSWRLADGRRIVVRPVLPQDSELEQALVRALSPTARYQRFFSPIRELPAEWLVQLTQIDYDRHVALIAETFDSGVASAVAEARYVVDASRRSSEFAIVVAEAWQRHGIARRLLCSLIGHASTAGLVSMFGDVLASNTAMLALADRLGFTRRRHPDDARLVRVERRLDGRATQAAGRAHAAPARRAADHVVSLGY
jgi:acetyltransferase